ncbi:TPA: hypothetical protein L5705_002460 [Pseudomonas aeruginosa]|nr:hypothetical protein IPC171_25190 [Pseudomonas aeruginosa]TEM16592.1 hypothetical protein IPC170_05505 [Pseudomonas aeruginosa]TEM20189.1 hypothetical protein IPC169_00510 [Pseudomonas aeruginosa]TEM30215.1 hypothetical protein IPC167_00510 [Pseudomonas aeruginosa]TEM34073.1 hypothetical protein IPC166_02210 [Pseudomonas aeruginosa]
MEISGGRVGRKLCCMNIQYSRAADERRVVLGHAMEGAEIISASMFSLQLISGLQRHEYGYDAEIIHR